jgi:hypothetical protein
MNQSVTWDYSGYREAVHGMIEAEQSSIEQYSQRQRSQISTATWVVWPPGWIRTNISNGTRPDEQNPNQPWVRHPS